MVERRLGRDRFRDDRFRLHDNVDQTKQLAFQLSGISTGQTRVITVPDSDGTMLFNVVEDISPELGGNLALGGYDLTNGGTITAEQLTSIDDITAGDRFFASNGLVATPSYGFTGDDNTGMYLAGGNLIGFTAAGTLRFSIGPSEIDTFLPLNLNSNNILGAGAITGTSFIIGTNTLTTTEWAFLDSLDQALKTTDSPTFAGLTAGGLTTTAILSVALTGTVAANNGSDAIVGTGTNFDNGEIAIGDAIKIQSDEAAGYEIFTVSAITDDTHLTVDSNYEGSNDTGLSAWTDPDLLTIDNGDGTNYLTCNKSGNLAFAADKEISSIKVIRFTASGGFAAVDNADTYFTIASANSYFFAVNGETLLTLDNPAFGPSKFKININKVNADFIVSGDTVTNLLFVDGSANEVSIGGPLDVIGDADISGVLKVDAVQVVGNQQSHIVDADGTIGDITTKFNTLLSYLDADAGHGLLAAA